MTCPPLLRRSLLSTVVVAACLLVVALGFRRVWTVDYWWQWKTGQYVAEQGVPRTAIYSATNPDHERIELRWGYCLALYRITQWFGHEGAVAAKTLIIVAAFGLAVAAGGRKSDPVAASAVVSLAALAANQRFFVRPEVVSYLLLAAVVLIVERARHRPTRWIWALPILEVVWVNVQGLFILGPAVAGAWLTGECVEKGIERWRGTPADSDRPRRIRTALIALLALGAATIVNPYGYRAVLLPLLQFSALYGTAMKGFYVELTSPFAFGESWVALTYYKVLIGVVVGSVLLGFRRQSAYWAILVAAMFYLSASAIRNLPLFSVVAVPFVLRNLQHADLSWPRTVQGLGFWVARTRTLLGVATVLFCAYQIQQLATDRFTVRQGDTNQFGGGLARHRFPFAGADFLRSSGVQATLFNSSDAGSYLMAQGFDVFIDPRGEVYLDGIIDDYRAMTEHQPGGAELLEHYDFGVLFLDTSMARLIQQIHDKQAERWRVVFADEVSTIFFRSDVAPEIPALDISGDDATWWTDIRKTLPRPAPYESRGPFQRVTSPQPFHALARVCVALGNFAQARELFEDALAAYAPGFADHELLARVALETGSPSEALSYQLEAVTRAPQNAIARRQLVDLYIANDDLTRAAEQLEHYLRLRPDDADSLALRGRIDASQNRPAQGMSWLRRAVQLKPEDGDLRFQLGQLGLLAGQLDEAFEAFERAFEMGTSPAMAAQNLALISGRRGEIRAAREWAERAYALAPDDPAIRQLWEGVNQQ